MAEKKATPKEAKLEPGKTPPTPNVKPSTVTRAVQAAPATPAISTEPTNQNIFDRIDELDTSLMQTLGQMSEVAAARQDRKPMGWLPYPRVQPGHQVACIVRAENGRLRLASLQDAAHPYWRDVITGANVKWTVTHWCAIPPFEVEELPEAKPDFPDTTVEGQVDAAGSSGERKADD